MPLPELLGGEWVCCRWRPAAQLIGSVCVADACVMPTSKLVSDVDGGLTLHDRYVAACVRRAMVSSYMMFVCGRYLWLTYHQVCTPHFLAESCNSIVTQNVRGVLWLFAQVGELSTKIAKGLRSTLPYGAHVGPTWAPYGGAYFVCDIGTATEPPPHFKEFPCSI